MESEAKYTDAVEMPSGKGEPLKPRRRGAGKVVGAVRDHGLSIVLGSVLVAQAMTWLITVRPHLPEKAPLSYIVAEFMLSTLADTYGMLLIVVLTKWFTERGSKEVE